MEILIQLGLIIFLVFLNGFFVASEFALVAVRKTRITELAKKGNTSAKFVQKALNNLDTFISATQLGITLASLALGWIGEPAIAHFLEPLFHTYLPQDAAVITSHGMAFTIAFSIITFLHIVLGELAPKTIALQKAEVTSLLIITPLSLFATIFKPFIWILNKTGFLVLKLIGFPAPTGHQLVHSEEEIKMILAQSAEEGAIEKAEAEMVYSVLKFGDLPVKQIMIPRTKIIAFDIDTSLHKVIQAAERNLHSRFPVFKGSIDNVVGFIHIKEVYKYLLSDSKLKFVGGIYRTFLKKEEGIKISQTKLIRDVLQIPESRRIDDVLLDMRKKRIHIAIVNDEYGGTAGVVTLEDIIESLVGEIQDEFEKPYSEIQKRKDGSYLVDGFASIENVKSKLKLPIKGQGYTTIGGLVFGLLGHEPTIGEKINIGEVELEIFEAGKNRIKKIIVKKMV
ncbi:HlyC/CorC family transporter [Candidatus Roizmanbacteria bacterium]|nr:HlyC/CorC family transporter [Candidatus Roizmanbacteria bacterium]